MPPSAPETKVEAEADLQRIRAALRAEWEAMDGTLEPERMDALLYCATVFGLGADDQFAPIRTDWWRASYLPGREVPGINKPGNLIEITGDEVWLGVERVSTAVPLCANVSRRVEFPCVSISPGRTNETETV